MLADATAVAALLLDGGQGGGGGDDDAAGDAVRNGEADKWVPVPPVGDGSSKETVRLVNMNQGKPVGGPSPESTLEAAAATIRGILDRSAQGQAADAQLRAQLLENARLQQRLVAAEGERAAALAREAAEHRAREAALMPMAGASTAGAGAAGGGAPAARALSGAI